MLRMYVMHQPKRLEEFLPLVEFSYNNAYQESLNMSPFKALYGKKFNAPIKSNDLMKRVHIKPDMLREIEHEVIVIKKKLKIVEDRNKSYVNQ